MAHLGWVSTLWKILLFIKLSLDWKYNHIAQCLNQTTLTTNPNPYCICQQNIGLGEMGLGEVERHRQGKPIHT